MFRALIFIFVLALAPATAIVASAETRVPSSRSEIDLSFAPLVRRAAPAVVNVYTRRVEQVRESSPFFNDPFFRQFFGDQFPLGQPRERIARSLGSGVIVRPDGIIVTNNHVIERATQIVVALADRREFEAKVIAADARVDLAILRIDAQNETLPYLEFHNSDDLEVGDLVVAIGNPFGVGQTVTQGIISALGRTGIGEAAAQSFIQTDAAINPGNSGGALVTLDGKLAGINTAIFSRSGGSIGIGFAIPSNLVEATLSSALAGKGIRRPWLGANGESVTHEIARNQGLGRPAGVLIESVYPAGPADRAGLRTGDVVLAVNGREVDDPQGLKFRIATGKLDGSATLDVFRKGQRLALHLPLAAAPENPPRNLTQIAGNNPFAGAKVANLSPAFAEELGIEEPLSGVIVTEVAPGSTAARIGIRSGDLVIKINDHDVKDVGEMQRLLRSADRWALVLRRGDQLLSFSVRA